MAKTKLPEWKFDPGTVKTNGNVTLVVARRSGKKLRGNRIAMHQTVAAELRAACRATLELFEGKTARPFDPDGLIETDQYLTAPDAAVDTDASVKELLSDTTALPFLGAGDLPRTGFAFYAVELGPASARSSFIRQYNPRRTARPGRVWTVFGDDLRKLEEPVFVFDSTFDMVSTPQGVAALNQPAFERIFRDISVMTGRLPDYVEHITSKLPMADDGAARFLAKCAQNSRVANRARAIYERGHLEEVTIGEIKKEIKRQNLDASKLIKGEELVFDDADPYTLLKLLNEDLFIGGLSKTPYAADRKSARS